ncbi:hypothetical protein CsSME_00044100 [Camellia sinensis var. sinensis]
MRANALLPRPEPSRPLHCHDRPEAGTYHSAIKLHTCQSAPSPSASILHHNISFTYRSFTGTREIAADQTSRSKSATSHTATTLHNDRPSTTYEMQPLTCFKFATISCTL